MSYRMKMWGAAGLSLAAAVGAGMAGSYLAAHNAPGTNFWLVFPLLILAAGLAMLAAKPWWRQLDDVQRQGHTGSWYWGSMIGGLSFVMYLVADVGRQSALTRGAVYLLLAEFAGFVLLYAFWRWRGRGEAE